MNYKIIKPVSLLILTAFVVSGCSLLPKKAEEPNLNTEVQVKTQAPNIVLAAKTGKMKKFADKDELIGFLKNNSIADSSLNSSDKLSPIVELDYFHNNNSLSTRSADIIKRSGNFIFSLVKNEVMVLGTGDFGNSIVSKITLDVNPAGLLLSENSLVVYGENKINDTDVIFVKVYDVKKPSAPELVQDFAFAAKLNDIFIASGKLYVINESPLNYVAGSRVLPGVFSDGNLLADTCDGVERCFAPEVFYFDINYKQARFLSINAIDLNKVFNALTGKAYLLGANHKVMTSDDSVFIAFSDTVDEDSFYFEAEKKLIFNLLNSGEKEQIKDIENSPSFALSDSEKIVKIRAVFSGYLNNLLPADKALLAVDIKNEVSKKKEASGSANKTAIHKIRLSNKGIDYYAFNNVPGDVMNNYSLLQKDNHIYLATRGEDKLSSTGELKHYVNIFIFDKALKMIGKMENLSSKEKIYGVRFLGNRAYLVSAEDNASLFVVSLEKKTEPSFAGTLKAPAVPMYLRPIDENANKFIGLSYSLDSTTNTKQGLKLSLLDFSDLKAPKEVSSYLIGDAESDSLVFNDSASLFYSAENKTLILPVTFAENRSLYFSGIFAFRVSENSLEMIGKSDHSAGGFYNQVDNLNGLTYLDNSAKRSFVESNKFYSVSNKFLTTSTANNMEQPELLELNFYTDDLLVSSFRSKNPAISQMERESFIDDVDGGSRVEIEGDLFAPEPESDELFDIPEYFDEPRSEENQIIEENRFEETQYIDEETETFIDVIPEEQFFEHGQDAGESSPSAPTEESELF